MFFRKKGWLRKEYNEKLLLDLLELKEQWNRQKKIIEKSVEPSPEVLYELKLAESKYFFLLKEAKNRRVTLK
ncbi:YaaL family protein [Bacillus alveayuensis]|uniref:DUF2508 family protein n=1 Tax=Aeribacillus alveayuensis TaxID=279215 RepID=A0ABT9VSG8_9BACI|nr:YaaL family protein [Bacillus alveayuensis]MDQ0163936.1 hypothetical protein [Bacillus alveayuensis]